METINIKNFISYEYITSPITGYKCKMINIQNIKLFGFNSKEELLKTYPGFPLCSQKYKDSRSKAMRGNLKIMGENNPAKRLDVRKKISLSSSVRPGTMTGKKHTEKTKKLISEKRKEFLLKNPDKVPYLLNHYSKGQSYPEKYFDLIFKKKEMKYIKEFRIGLYSLDFYFQDARINVEINGDQHYLDSRIIKSDERRKNFLKSKGIKMIPIKWSSFKKLKIEDRKKYVSALIEKIWRTERESNPLCVD